MQLQARLEESRRRVLLVLISRERMAASSSVRTVEAPCMEVPPVMFTLVGLDVEEDGGAGEDVRVVGVLFVLKSDIKVPDAEGGPLRGAWMADGLGSREKALFGVEVPEFVGVGLFGM